MKLNAKRHLLAFEEEDVEEHLLAVHTALEGFQIAYYLNKNTAASFKRQDDITLNDKGIFFSLFEYLDLKLFTKPKSAKKVEFLFSCLYSV